MINDDWLYNQLSLTCRKALTERGILSHRLHNSKSNELAFKYGNRREFEIIERDEYYEIGTRLVNYVQVLKSIPCLEIRTRNDPDGRRIDTLVKCMNVKQVSDVIEKMVLIGFEEEAIQNYR